MKYLAISILLFFGVFQTQAQDPTTVLDEITIDIGPHAVKIIQYGDEFGDVFTYKIKRKYAFEFAQNPIAFMKSNFDIDTFISEVAKNKYDSYEVTFSVSSGFLKANFDDEGNLLKTVQNFKNKVLPPELRNKIYLAYEGWVITKNKYIATTKGDIKDKEIYRLKLKKDNKTKIVTINGLEPDLDIVSN